MSDKSFIRGVSIILCCYNSANRLPETLRHLSLQKVPSNVSCEIILVNNGSTDDTVELALKVWTSFGCNIPFKVVHQPVSGLSFAREKGIESAQYEYILFCDDDNWLNKDYIHLAYNIINSNPSIGAVGGIGIPECEIVPPHWFYKYSGYYATGPQDKSSGDITYSNRCLYGAGVVYRKIALKHIFDNGFRFNLTGRKGKQMLSREDNELSLALVLAGWKIWYDEQLTFKHFIPKQRLTWNYVTKLVRGNAFSMALVRPYDYALGCSKVKEYQKQYWWFIAINAYFLVRYDSILYLQKLFSKERYIAQLNMQTHIGEILGHWEFRKRIKPMISEIESFKNTLASNSQ